MDDSIKIFSGQANVPFCDNICQTLGVLKSSIEYIRFNDGELSVKILESVRGKDVFLIQSLSAPVNDHLMEMLITIDALKRASAKRISVIIPYFAYARQDRLGDGRQPISAKLLANLISSAGANRVLTIEPHTPQLMAFFDSPVDGLSGARVFVDYAKKNFNLNNVIIVSPDVGGVERARFYAMRLGNLPLAVINKRRDRPNHVAEMFLVGDVYEKHAIIIDDMVDTARTLIKASDLLLEEGALDVSAFVVHPILSRDAVERVQDSNMQKLIVTDTIFHDDLDKKIISIPITSLVANAIKKLHLEESLSDLY